MTQPQPVADRAAQAAAVIAAYQLATSALRTHLTQVITALWRSLGVYREAEMRQFAAQVVPVVQGAMGQMQALTAAYLATLDGASIPIAARRLGIGDVRNGADPADVYGRPFHLVWRRLDDLKPLDGPKIEQAIQSGLDRAVQTAVTDVQLAKTHTARDVLAADKRVVGYRRVLEGAHSCGLCVVASTQRYHKAELMPMHPGCDCQVAPIIGDHDPGRVINAPLLAQAHDAVAQRFGADSSAAREFRAGNGERINYRDLLITHEHGELGPVLGLRGQDFTSPADVAAGILAAAS